MHHIDRIRLLNHPDPRMRAAAADAARLRSELWRLVLSRAFSAVQKAVRALLRAAGRRLGPSTECRESHTAMGGLWPKPRTEGCR
ncbi:hypothetical protein [Roseovarius sp. D22-M7]|uniref:hypothetical protein n=1 Tax=Roseovarius sp. D22-M7 TaxID=3127116 RepID=UPI00301029F5